MFTVPYLGMSQQWRYLLCDMRRRPQGYAAVQIGPALHLYHPERNQHIFKQITLSRDF